MEEESLRIGRIVPARTLLALSVLALFSRVAAEANGISTTPLKRAREVLERALASRGPAKEFEVPPAAVANDAELARAMPELATRVLVVYRDDDRETYLDNLFRLQLVAGRYGDAAETITALRRLRSSKIPDSGAWIDVQYEVLARAKLKQATNKLPFAEAFQQIFRDVVGQLKDVSDKTIHDAKTPLEIKWYGDSYVELPVAMTPP